MPEEPKIRLLLISYLFPPCGGIAVQRALSLRNTSPTPDSKFDVLSGRNAAGPVMDPSLLKQVPASVKTYEAFTPEIPFHLRQRIWRLLRSQSNSPRKAEAKPVTPGGLKKALKQLRHNASCVRSRRFYGSPFAVSKSREIIRRAGIQVVLITVPPFSALVVGTKLKREFPHLKFVADFRDEWLDFYLNEFDFQNSPQTRRRAVEIERDTV